MPENSTSSAVSSAETVETVAVPADTSRPLLSTSFSDYTVTEGLLLLIFVILLLDFF